jgi:hypothetical protein
LFEEVTFEIGPAIAPLRASFNANYLAI